MGDMTGELLSRPRVPVCCGIRAANEVSVAARVCFPDTSLKVSQMPGERHVACIELHNSSGPPAPKLRSSEAGSPTSDGRQLLPT